MTWELTPSPSLTLGYSPHFVGERSGFRICPPSQMGEGPCAGAQRRRR